MADVLTVQDLEAAKKHDTFHSEVITGRAGGSASGAEIDTATNAVTGQVQTTLPKVLRDVGFKPASFTFVTGGTLGVTDADKCIYNPAPAGDNNWYSWGGDLPHTVVPGADPKAVGSGYVPRTDVALRSELAIVGSKVIISGKEAGEIVLDQKFSGTDLLGAFFKSTDSALYLYKSRDGVNFSSLSSTPVYSLSGRALRDPSVIKYGDAWWCIYSNVPSNSDFNTTHFGIARSYNLVDWSHVLEVDTGTPNTWAPDWFVDDDGSVYAVVALNFDTHLIPIDLESLTSGTPISIGIPGSSIDGVIQLSDGVYYLFIKNETTKYIERYTASSVTGPYTKTGSGDWAGWGANVEGPCLLKQNDGTWRIYFDGYSIGKYYTSTSVSLGSDSWSTKIEVSKSGEVRHGSVIPLITQSERLDSVYADSQLNDGSPVVAVEVVSGMAEVGQAVTSKAEAVRSSCWMHFRTDVDAAVFQSRGITDSTTGIDFVDRRTEGYASIEIMTGGIPTKVIKCWGITNNFKIEFPQGILVSGWATNVAYANGWSSNSGAPFKYRKDPLGRVTFTGIVQGGTQTSTTVMFTMPVGFRPASFVVFPVVSNDVSVGTVGIVPDGTVVILSGTNVKLDLSSISYYVD